MIELNASDLWVIATASLCGVACATTGVFLVLRGLSMLADAVSHSILLGIVGAFLLTGSRAPLVVLLGAGAVGILTAVIAQYLNREGKLQEDASIGVTFTWLFAVGVILVSAFAGQVDIDQECVLYGEIAFIPFDTLSLFGMEIGPRAFWNLAFVSFLSLLVIGGVRSRFELIAFDPLLSQTAGIAVQWWHYLLIGLVSLTSVASFEAVGVILVVGMIVIPPNAARLLSSGTREMLVLSNLFALVAVILGYWLAVRYDAAVSASMVAVAGTLFLLVAFLSWLFRSRAGAVVSPSLYGGREKEVGRV